MAKLHIEKRETPDSLTLALYKHTELIMTAAQALIDEQPDHCTKSKDQIASATFKLPSTPPSPTLSNSPWYIESVKITRNFESTTSTNWQVVLFFLHYSTTGLQERNEIVFTVSDRNGQLIISITKKKGEQITLFIETNLNRPDHLHSSDMIILSHCESYLKPLLLEAQGQMSRKVVREVISAG